MRCLTIREPWCELILSGKKTVEVRKMRTHYRGWIILTCSKSSKAARAGHAFAIAMRQVRSALSEHLNDSRMNRCSSERCIAVLISKVNRRSGVEQIESRSESTLISCMNDGLWADHLIAWKLFYARCSKNLDDLVQIVRQRI